MKHNQTYSVHEEGQKQSNYSQGTGMTLLGSKIISEYSTFETEL